VRGHRAIRRKGEPVYIPEHFRVRHEADALAFMRANPFAILISTATDAPFATHVPLHAQEVENQVLLRGHVAKANPHWNYLKQQPQCLSIFHGPHAYISPTNYAARESVPTWNYAAVHAYGEARLFTTETEVHSMLDELMNTFEPSYREQWETLSPKYRENMLRQIVGFEIRVTRLEGKFKLSQNRIREDQGRVISRLEKAEDSVVSGVARLMKEQVLAVVPSDAKEKK
jgi:transcriptional regulator